VFPYGTISPDMPFRFVGTDIVFKITVWGDLPILIQWMKNETIVEPNGQNQFMLTNLNLHDTGLYCAKLINRAGSTFQCTKLTSKLLFFFIFLMFWCNFVAQSKSASAFHKKSLDSVKISNSSIG
jgi:hypothetical protein